MRTEMTEWDILRGNIHAVKKCFGDLLRVIDCIFEICYALAKAFSINVRVRPSVSPSLYWRSENGCFV